MLASTHPRYLPGPLQLPATRTQHYSNFTHTMPDQPDSACAGDPHPLIRTRLPPPP